jgi:coenzyme F420-reducing hydrogenase gamma subunit
MTRLLFIASLVALGGCAVLSNVTSIGNGAFMTAVHGNDVNARVDQETAQAMAQAVSFCKERGATVDVIKVDAPAPPPGRPPSAEVDFRCKAAS